MTGHREPNPACTHCDPPLQSLALDGAPRHDNADVQILQWEIQMTWERWDQIPTSNLCIITKH